MAVTVFSRGYVLAAANDVLTGVKRVNKIHIVNDSASAAAVTLRSDGTSGTVILKGNAPANDTVNVPFGDPQDMTDLAVTVLPANVTVVVFVS